MIKIENVEVVGFEHAIRGMRNPMNSWEKSDSKHCIDSSLYEHCIDCPYVEDFCDPANIGCMEKNYLVGLNDYKLMKKLSSGGPVHGKFKRMIVVYLDITAPLYWWKEFDTYKVGTVANSCSTMHKIAEKEFTFNDFSFENLIGYDELYWGDVVPLATLDSVIHTLNVYREKFIETKDKKYWWQMIQLLPTSYNQLRTVMLNYEVLTNIYNSRKNHKLDEWHILCDFIKDLPYSGIIIGDDI